MIGVMTGRRRRSRRLPPKRTATRKPAAPTLPRLKVAIATSPSTTRAGPSLAHEVSLVRAAILYADEVELVSPGAEMLGGAEALVQGDEWDLLRLLTSFDDETISSLAGGTLPPDWRNLLPSVGAFTDEHWDLVGEITGTPAPEEMRTATARFQRAMSEALATLRESVDVMLDNAGAREIAPAMRRGSYEYHQSHSDQKPAATSMRYFGVISKSFMSCWPTQEHISC